jgi:hypothetical protein
MQNHSEQFWTKYKRHREDPEVVRHRRGRFEYPSPHCSDLGPSGDRFRGIWRGSRGLGGVRGDPWCRLIFCINASSENLCHDFLVPSGSDECLEDL